jgi:hypothetical protein
LEKNIPILDGEALRKQELLAHQYDLVINHRQNNGKPTGSFEEHYALNPAQALHTVTLYDRFLIPLLEKSKSESLMKPSVADGHLKTESITRDQVEGKGHKSGNEIDQVHLQEKPLEKNISVLDWEGLRKKELSAHQYALVITHRQNNGKPTGAFEEHYALNPDQALNKVTLYDLSISSEESLKFLDPVLEEKHINPNLSLEVERSNLGVDSTQDDNSENDQEESHEISRSRGIEL